MKNASEAGDTLSVPTTMPQKSKETSINCVRLLKLFLVLLDSTLK